MLVLQQKSCSVDRSLHCPLGFAVMVTAGWSAPGVALQERCDACQSDHDGCSTQRGFCVGLGSGGRFHSECSRIPRQRLRHAIDRYRTRLHSVLCSGLGHCDRRLSLLWLSVRLSACGPIHRASAVDSNLWVLPSPWLPLLSQGRSAVARGGTEFCAVGTGCSLRTDRRELSDDAGGAGDDGYADDAQPAGSRGVARFATA